MQILLQFFICFMFFSQTVFCSSLSPSRSSIEEPRIFMKENEKLLKNKIAEQCAMKVEQRNLSRQKECVAQALCVHRTQLELLQQNPVQKINPDAIVLSWLDNSIILPAVHQLLCHDVYTMQQRYNYQGTLHSAEYARICNRNALLAIMSDQDRQLCMNYPGPDSIVLHGMEKLAADLHQSQDALQEGVYQSQISIHNQKKNQVLFSVHQNLAEQTQLDTFLQQNNLSQEECAQQFANLVQDRKKMEQEILAFEQAQQKLEQKLMMAEDVRIHDAMKIDKKQKRKVIQKKQAELAQEDHERIAMQQEELQQKHVLEQKKRMAQSAADKLRNLQQMQARHNEQRIQQQEQIEYAARQKELAKKAKENRLLLDREKEQEQSALENAIAKSKIDALQIQEREQAKKTLQYLDFPKRMSIEQFEKTCYTQQFKGAMQIFFQNFADITAQLTNGNCSQENLMQFDEFFEQMQKIHQQLIVENAGISYSMAQHPLIYRMIVTSYRTLYDHVGEESLPKLEKRKEQLKNNQAVLQQNLNVIKEGYTAALRKNHSSINKFLPVLKTEKDQLDRVVQDLCTTDHRIKQKLVFNSLMKACGLGGFLDPMRFLDKVPGPSVKPVIMSSEDLNGCFRELADKIYATLQIPDPTGSHEIDPFFKISTDKVEQIYFDTLETLDRIFKAVGLENYELKSSLAIKYYNHARLFSDDYAEGFFDVDGYRYFTQKMFNLEQDKCNLSQYNTLQEMSIKLIALYAEKFHNPLSRKATTGMATDK